MKLTIIFLELSEPLRVVDVLTVTPVKGTMANGIVFGVSGGQVGAGAVVKYARGEHLSVSKHSSESHGVAAMVDGEMSCYIGDDAGVAVYERVVKTWHGAT